jgi:hypothetical protein
VNLTPHLLGYADDNSLGKDINTIKKKRALLVSSNEVSLEATSEKTVTKTQDKIIICRELINPENKGSKSILHSHAN